MNPSAKDLIEAFDKVNAERIFVFPNNGNVILTAEQAAKLYSESEIIVINTKTIGEGYAAISMMETDGKTEDIIDGIKESVKEVVTACVSKANRSTEKNGVEVKSGDYIGFVGDDIMSDSADINEAAEKLLDKINIKNHGLVLMFIGEDANENDAARLVDYITAQNPETEVITVDGGQPVFDYMFVLE